ncbi:26S proteasome non-ATPase regulatory subunit 9 [Halotydeus destructor]|nr:26S proteasome non-ATPase regulatory subunit 9 [Halotydeus destructor]
MDKREQLRTDLLELNKKRNKIESEIKTWNEVLSTQKVGMNDDLIDGEGFPRNDIDVYQVRTARNKIRTLTNDARQVMGEIETKLYEFHALKPSSNGSKS